MHLLITGGAGVIGSNFIRYILNKYSDYSVVNLDKLTYAGNLDNLKDVEREVGMTNSRYKFIKGDICDEKLVFEIVKNVDVIVNFAAETHVDRSIHFNDGEFIRTDILGTVTLLEAVRRCPNIKKYIQISTDEVYGDIEENYFSKETDRLRPSNPYSASKAGGDLQVLSYIRTYDVPAMITRCSNNYGSYMHLEKMIPLFITNLLLDKKVPVYGDGKQIRDWLFVEDHCSAIDLVLHEGKLGEIYNIGANNEPEVSNLSITLELLKLLGKDESFIEYVKDRPGHDRRYAINCEKIKSLGWKANYNLEKGLEMTVSWYRENSWWWEKVRESGDFREWEGVIRN